MKGFSGGQGDREKKKFSCPQCGATEGVEGNFCGSCGARLRQKEGGRRPGVLGKRWPIFLLLAGACLLIFFLVPGLYEGQSPRGAWIGKKEAPVISKGDDSLTPQRDKEDLEEEEADEWLEEGEDGKETLEEGPKFIPQPSKYNSSSVNAIIERAMAAPRDEFYVTVNGEEAYRTPYPLRVGKGTLVPLYEILQELRPYYLDWYNDLSIHTSRSPEAPYTGKDLSLRDGDTFRIFYVDESCFVSGTFTLGENLLEYDEYDDSEEWESFSDLITPPAVIEGRIFMDIRDIKNEIIECDAKQVGDELRITSRVPEN